MVAFGLKALPSAVFLGLLSPALGCIVFTGQLYGNTRSVDNFGTAYGWMTVTDNDVEICTGNIFKGDKNLGNTVVLDSGTLRMFSL
ncbi:hypothetical protein N7462_004259 [Penicillium macrosclerotiorum]|uniref:uncharacterized protein n=1 Tax=Penicillium macrosclerotiorum TaxID=303699 RepID=UPI002549B99B|nr:uncharacterized protein N7462_004259 [Penicillium macrosclerotiorum]KAJ5689867.1 hypothetical protein N7462_004259 [Penicillium macrosclerotiorum]